MSELKYADITKKIIGAAFNVHKILGNGFQEKIYQKALAIEMRLEELQFQKEFEMKIFFRGEEIGERRVDFLVEDVISIEIKALVQLENVHLAQAKNYLEAYNLEVGLLINFGDVSVKFNRLQNLNFKTQTQ